MSGPRRPSFTRDEALANAKSIVEATHLPVAADLENGYGHTPEDAAVIARVQEIYRVHGWLDLEQYEKEKCLQSVMAVTKDLY